MDELSPTNRKFPTNYKNCGPAVSPERKREIFHELELKRATRYDAILGRSPKDKQRERLKHKFQKQLRTFYEVPPFPTGGATGIGGGNRTRGRGTSGYLGGGAEDPEKGGISDVPEEPIDATLPPLVHTLSLPTFRKCSKNYAGPVRAVWSRVVFGAFAESILVVTDCVAATT